MKFVTILASLALVLGLVASASALLVETQNFDDTTAAAAAGWTRVGSAPNFYNGTAKAGNGLEAGGGYTAGQVDYFGDTDLGGTISQTDTITASGTSYWSNDEMMIGHFKKGTRGNADSVGIQMHSDYYVYAVIDGSISAQSSKKWRNPDRKYSWDYTYTYDSGTSSGSIVVHLSDGTNSETMNFIKANPSFTMDTFGMVEVYDKSKNPGYWMDDVSYSSHVPEPATVALLGLGSLVMLRRRR